MSERPFVGLVANPASGRDIRRIVARGANVTTNEKLNIIERLLVGLASAGIDRVVSMVDLSGLSAGLVRLVHRTSSAIPHVEFLEQEISRTRRDTVEATNQLVARGAGCLVVLGGDGTHRAVAEASGDTPIVGLSTGTNNAFPAVREPTVAGIAAGLVAHRRVSVAEATNRATVLCVVSGERSDVGLVDVAITGDDRVGSGALWEAGSLRELYLAFAEPHAIGLSSIGGLLRPVPRSVAEGLRITFGTGVNVTAPIAPGLSAEVGVASVDVIEPGERVTVGVEEGVVAIDGEREYRFGRGDAPTIHIDEAGPVIVDIDRTMAIAAGRGLFTS